MHFDVYVAAHLAGVMVPDKFFSQARMQGRDARGFARRDGFLGDLQYVRA